MLPQDAALTAGVGGARAFGWQYAADDLPEELRGTSLFHSGWSGQTVLIDLKRRRYAVVLTTRCGAYGRAKRDRFKAIAALMGEQSKISCSSPRIAKCPGNGVCAERCRADAPPFSPVVPEFLRVKGTAGR